MDSYNSHKQKLLGFPNIFLDNKEVMRLRGLRIAGLSGSLIKWTKNIYTAGHCSMMCNKGGNDVLSIRERINCNTFIQWNII